VKKKPEKVPCDGPPQKCWCFFSFPDAQRYWIGSSWKFIRAHYELKQKQPADDKLWLALNASPPDDDM
jgi:hypothetical protein